MDYILEPGSMAEKIFNSKYGMRSLTEIQTWAERAEEMARGNHELDTLGWSLDVEDFVKLCRDGVVPMAGRHLHHGGPNQKDKVGELLTNCSTSFSSATKFYQLLKGSGVGRKYADAISLVNWDYMPDIRLVLEAPNYTPGYECDGHLDFSYDWMESLQEAKALYPADAEDVRWFEVEDSAEGWVKVVEILEVAAFQRRHKDKLFIFDFSKVRGKGQPIMGQQGRPACGPVPLMKAVRAIANLKGIGFPPWKQAMHIDHYLAEAVQLGGVRRSARIATKPWTDKDIKEFIAIKRGGRLHTANNSVEVDAEFWEQAQDPRTEAFSILMAIIAANYFDKSGEPGLITVDNLHFDTTGVENITGDNLISDEYKEKLKLHPKTIEMFDSLLAKSKTLQYPYLVNPCGEIVLAVWGAYCVIGEVCMAKASGYKHLEKAVRHTTQALIRVNRFMPFMYDTEVKRTNRIGVGLTGIHEYLVKEYSVNVIGLINDANHPFREELRKLNAAVKDEAKKYSEKLRMVTPHSDCTIKPSGTISKVLNCTAGAHLDTAAIYLRWVQYPLDSKEYLEYSEAGYPHKDISSQYQGYGVIGFPVKRDLDKLQPELTLSATDLSIKQHIQWLHILEECWLGETGNQVSYTLMYDADKTIFEDFLANLRHLLPTVKCCSTLPLVDISKYAYVPEEPISLERYNQAMKNINTFLGEDYDEDQLKCESGACPIEESFYIPEEAN